MVGVYGKRALRVNKVKWEKLGMVVEVVRINQETKCKAE